jgi:hypothetical protein
MPKNFGKKSAGSMKADEWRTLATIYLPLALVSLWGEQQTRVMGTSSSTGEILDHTMHLVQAVSIAMSYTITPGMAASYRDHMKAWTENLLRLFPALQQQKRTRTNIHVAFHIYDFLLDLGPVISWWAFPFERLIGILQKIPTNEHIGGEMEATIVQSFMIGGNLRRWLRREDCPPAIQELKRLFDKAFQPLTPAFHSVEGTRKSQQDISYYTVTDSPFGRFVYSPARVHTGNSVIVYRNPRNSSEVIAGEIQQIDLVKGSPRFTIRRHAPLLQSLVDPFLKYPDFHARCYSSNFLPTPDVAYMHHIISHAACLSLTNNHSVILNLSRL